MRKIQISGDFRNAKIISNWIRNDIFSISLPFENKLSSKITFSVKITFFSKTLTSSKNDPASSKNDPIPDLKKAQVSQNVPSISKRPTLQSKNGPTITKCPKYLKMSQLAILKCPNFLMWKVAESYEIREILGKLGKMLKVCPCHFLSYTVFPCHSLSFPAV